MKKSAYLLAFVAIASLAIFSVYAYRDAVYTKLNDFKLIPQEERFTELYLNDYLTFPKEIVKGQKVTFSFTVHNLEGKTVTYPYVAYLKTEDGYRISIARGSVTLADKESRIVTESYTFKSALKTEKVTVFIELPDQGQSLHFKLPSTM